MNRGLIGCLLVCFYLVGCSALVRTFAEEPQLRLKSISVKSFSLSKVEFVIKTEIKNLNRFDLKLSALDYKVYMKDQEVGYGSFSEALNVGGGTTAALDLPFLINPDAALKVAQLFFSGNDSGLEARIVGVAKFSLPIGSYEYQFDENKPIIKSK